MERPTEATKEVEREVAAKVNWCSDRARVGFLDFIRGQRTTNSSVPYVGNPFAEILAPHLPSIYLE